MSSKLQLRTLYLHPDKASWPECVRVARVSGLLHEAILRVCEQGCLDERVDQDRCLQVIIMAELDWCDRGSFVLVQPQDARAQKLADLFFDPGLQGHPLETLCIRAGLTRRTAERIFQRECGLPPAQWRRFAALSESLVNIAGGATIEQAAVAAGYESRSAFSEAFSLAFGFPPSDARKH